MTPVGKPKVIFNAHRIYDAADVEKLFDGFTLKDFSLVKDNNEFISDCNIAEAASQQYGCGCFWFVKNNV